MKSALPSLGGGDQLGQRNDKGAENRLTTGGRPYMSSLSLLSLSLWDNAVAESIFSSLKKERIKRRIYKTRDLARADVFDYIELFYNR
jgi:transposase InsO family protein